MQYWGFRVLIKRLKAIRFMMADKTVPLRKKAIIIAGIVYLFLPFDIIPPFILPFGIIDDIIVWLLILWYLSSELDKYWIGEKPRDYSRKYRGKTVVDDVEYDVDDGVEQEKEPAKEPEEASATAAETESAAEPEEASAAAAETESAAEPESAAETEPAAEQPETDPQTKED